MIVNLKSEDSGALRGVLWSTRGPWLTLRNVSVIRTGGGVSALDGEAIIHRDNVSFLQVVS